jgi:hypothetical protein
MSGTTVSAGGTVTSSRAPLTQWPETVDHVTLKPIRLWGGRPTSLSTAGSGVATSLVCRPWEATSIRGLTLKRQVRDETLVTATNPAA